ncbi:glycosyltransferase family 2 protein [Planctomycetota bacterium]|nr:glycosyltransferase family 2 protein [Planctomycetota bacterium]
MSTQGKLISVVVPTYNRSSRIPIVAQMVADQTYRPLELVFVNDGSTDDTSNALDALPDNIDGVAIKVFHQENGGVSAARNRGIRAATGTYLALLDDDDDWLPQKLALQYEAIIEHDCLASLCEIRVQNIDRPQATAQNPFRDTPSTGEIAEYLDGNRHSLVQALLFHRESVLRIGLFREDMARREDTEFILRIVASLPLANIREELTIYNLSNDSLSAPATGLAALRDYETSIEIMLASLDSFSKSARWWDHDAFVRRCVKDYDCIIKHRLYVGDIENALRLYKNAITLLGKPKLMKKTRSKIRKAKFLRLFGKNIIHPRHKNPEDIII